MVPEEIGAITIDKVTFNAAGIFEDSAEDKETDVLNHLVNNNSKEFSLTWANQEGETVKTSNHVITFECSTSGVGIDQTYFRILENCSAIIGDADYNMQKVTPIIVYQ